MNYNAIEKGITGSLAAAFFIPEMYPEWEEYTSKLLAG